MSWTTISDLRAQVQKLWDRGALLAACTQGEAAALFPYRLRLAGPASTELSDRFDEVRAWMADLRQSNTKGGGPPLRIVLREVRHRVLGTNSIPEEIWIDTLDGALALIGKQKEARRFIGLLELTRKRLPQALPWLQKRPLDALALAAVWPRLLDVVLWVNTHPRPGIYLRQVDLPGVDSKFIEGQRGVLSELLDWVLPAEAIDPGATGASQFCRRYGFQDKPLRIRFRMLDAGLALLHTGTDQDISVTQATFEQLDLPISRVFFTENEVNFLAFPPVPNSMVVFGAGYGFDVLAGTRWLHRCRIHYWGDIDTHGFAILDQLRAHLPHAESLLMDRPTLMAHTAQWGEEPQALVRDLPRLDAQEAALFDALRDNRLRPRLRLEQERIGFGWLQQALAGLLADAVSPNAVYQQPPWVEIQPSHD